MVVESHNCTLVGQVGTGSGTHLGGNKYLRSVLTDGPVATITQLVTEYEYHDTYTLRDPDMKSKALPLTLPKVTFDGLAEHLQEQYVRDITSGERSRLLDVSSHLPLPGDLPTEPAPKNWKPSHWVHIYGPNASHLVPGVLVGFRAHMKEIGATYGDCYDHNSASKMTFNVRAYWSPPRGVTEKQGRKRIQRESWMTSRLELDVLDEVGGTTLTDAQVNWAAREAELVAVLDAHGKTRTCGHCEGRGFITSTKGT